jgi:hypothetical protein
MHRIRIIFAAFGVAVLGANPALAAAKKFPLPLDPLGLNKQLTPSTNPVQALSAGSTDLVKALQAIAVPDVKAALADAQRFFTTSGGVGYVNGDTITLGDNLTILTVTDTLNGAVIDVDLTGIGPIANGNAAPGPLSQASTSGKGSGATFEQNDPLAALCYPTLLTIVQSAKFRNILPEQAGAVLLFQKARDLQNNITALQANLKNGSLNRNCAPVLVDSVATLNNLIAGFGIKAALAIPKPL